MADIERKRGDLTVEAAVLLALDHGRTAEEIRDAVERRLAADAPGQPMRLHVLVWTHRHGDSVVVTRTREEALSWLRAFAIEEWWGEAHELHPSLPEAPPDGMSDEELAELYFEAREDEHYTIEEVCLLEGGGASAS